MRTLSQHAMKRKVLVIFIVWLSALAGNAQIIFPRAGVAISRLSYEPDDTKLYSGTSFTFGFGAEFPLLKNFHLLVETNYLSREYRFYHDGEFGKGRQVFDVSYRHNYIDLPIQLKRYVGRTPLKFYFTAGGYVGIGLGGTKAGRWTDHHTVMDLDGEISYSRSENYSPDLYYYYFDHRIDAGAIAGAGIVLFKIAVLDVRYELGLVKIDQENMNRSFLIAVSVPLKLKAGEQKLK